MAAELNVELSPVRFRTALGIPICSVCLEPCVTCDESDAAGVCLGCRFMNFCAVPSRAGNAAAHELLRRN